MAMANENRNRANAEPRGEIKALWGDDLQHVGAAQSWVADRPVTFTAARSTVYPGSPSVRWAVAVDGETVGTFGEANRSLFPAPVPLGEGQRVTLTISDLPPDADLVWSVLEAG